jgi:hypothetical protein
MHMAWRPPLRQTTAAPELDGDCKIIDIVYELQALTFEPNAKRTIRIDEPVRDLFLSTLSARLPRRA